MAIDSDSYGNWEKVVEHPIMKIHKIKVYLHDFEINFLYSSLKIVQSFLLERRLL